MKRPQPAPPEFRSVSMVRDQYDLVMSAIALVRDIESDPQISSGRALELICAEFICGVATGEGRKKNETTA